MILKARYPCFCLAARLYLEINTGLPGVWGSWGEGLYIFKDLGFQGFEEQTYSFEGKPPYPPPLENLNGFTFEL